jgi:hypothetical protein
MVTRNGYIGAVPQQISGSAGNKGVLGINSHSIETRRDNIKIQKLPPVPASMTLRMYLDATLVSSYGGSGSTWYDISDNGTAYNATLFNASYQSSAAVPYFNVTSNFSFSTPANTIGQSNMTFFMVQATEDAQALLITDNGSTDFLGAYKSSNKYYNGNVSGSKNLYVDGVSVANLYDNIRGGSSKSIIITDCDFASTFNQVIYNTYSSFTFDQGAELYAMGVIEGNLSASEVSTLHNYFDENGMIGVSV